MGIRNSLQECVSVEGNRNVWFSKIEKSLEIADFKNIKTDSVLYQIGADYKKVTVWGEIIITLLPAGNSDNRTEINIKATSNIDNIFALFKSPNKVIINAFKEGLKKVEAILQDV